MEQKIRKMYTQDAAITLVSVLILAFVLCYVLFSINLILPDLKIKLAVLTVGTALGCYAIIIVLGVLNHLKNNKTELYTEEIMYCDGGIEKTEEVLR